MNYFNILRENIRKRGFYATLKDSKKYMTTLCRLKNNNISFEEYYNFNKFNEPRICTSQLCNQSFFGLPLFQYWMNRLNLTPKLHRKYWEWVYITQSLWENGYLKPGNKGLVFGVGVEPLPSLFASMGCEILATDLDINEGYSKKWKDADQLGE